MFAEKIRVLRSTGIRAGVKLALRRAFRQRAKCYHHWRSLFVGKRALEIGGPSTLFEQRSPLPVYPILDEVDNCLFSASTVWLPETRQGKNFRYDAGRRRGYQYICDGTDLHEISAGQYGCVLSCNNLEHIANPLKALTEWSRVLTDSGVMMVVVPAKDFTFDHRRSVATLAHLVRDWEHDVAEDDLSHLDEILSLHDLSRDLAAGDIDAFRERCERNNENRCLHHHVFDAELLASAMDFVGLQVCAVEAVLPYYWVAIARKIRPDGASNKAPFLDGMVGAGGYKRFRSGLGPSSQWETSRPSNAVCDDAAGSPKS